MMCELDNLRYYNEKYNDTHEIKWLVDLFIVKL